MNQGNSITQAQTRSIRSIQLGLLNFNPFNKRDGIGQYLIGEGSKLFETLHQIKCFKALYQKMGNFQINLRNQLKIKNQLVQEIANAIKATNIKQIESEYIIKIQKEDKIITPLQFYSREIEEYFHTFQDYQQIKDSVMEAFKQISGKYFWILVNVGKNRQPSPNELVQVGFELKKSLCKIFKKPVCVQKDQMDSFIQYVLTHGLALIITKQRMEPSANQIKRGWNPRKNNLFSMKLLQTKYSKKQTFQ